MNKKMTWKTYIITYSILALTYLWYRITLLFINDFKKKRKDEYTGSVSIIIPCFNEEPKLLEECIESVIKTEGNKQIILIDDHSTNEKTWNKAKELAKKHEILLLRNPTNLGKREAQALGLKHAKNDIIITIDSDTIVEKNALTNLIKPFSNENIGGTTGQALAKNNNENLLTKMINARYWSAFNIDRKSLSSFGVVTCATGVISAYRKSIIKPMMNEYTNQTFMGKKCTYGDDRCLTNFILKKGHDLVYVEDAIVYTEVPNNMKQFIKQQLRWKKSFIRESILSLQFAWKRSKIFFIEVIWNLLLPIFSIGVRISVLITALFNWKLAISLALGIMLVSFVRNIFMFIYDRKMAIYALPYAFVHELVIYWLYFYALFTLNDGRWLTR